MKLSMIVPVYNVEAFLKKCVDSLLAQDLPEEEYEIILVDDGSTDGSGELCDALAAENRNIRVIHQRNRGLSGARNSGIPVASGDFTLFVDSDDYLCPDVLGTLVRQMEDKELDILRFNYQNVKTDGGVFEPNRYVKPFVDYSDQVCDGETFLNERLGFACYAWQFLLRSSLLRKEGNGFREGIYFEDVEWTPRILLQAGRVASTGTIVYNYLFRTDSIARNTDLEKKRKSIGDKLAILEGFAGLKSQIHDARWLRGMTAQMVLSVLDTVSRYFYPERGRYIGLLRGMSVFPLSTYHSTRSAMRKIRLANLSPRLFCRLCSCKK